MDGSMLADHSGVPLEQLADQITELAGHLNAAQYRWLRLIGEFDRRGGWHGAQLLSCAHWLNFKCGLSLGSARERVRVAHALESLPLISGAMQRGELSYSKVRALTRVACAATEENLLMIALHGTAYHVETLVRLYRGAREAQELSREECQEANQMLSYHTDAEGSLVIRARIPAVGGALILQALEAALEQVPQSATSTVHLQEYEIGYEERRVRALVQVAESYLEHAAGQDFDRSQGTADRYQVVVHVDAETLQERSAGRCHIEHGTALAVETVRRLSCDSSRVTVIEDAQGTPLDVGRKTRTIAPAIRRALKVRDQGACCFPGCTYRRYLDAHHVDHWADGGATKLTNLVSLCRSHHRLVHEGQVRVETVVGGGWRFFNAEGEEFGRPLPSRSHDWRDLSRTHAALGLEIDAETAVTRWQGERMDYDLGVWVLCQQAAAAQSGHTDEADRENQADEADEMDPWEQAADPEHDPAPRFDVPAGTSQVPPSHWAAPPNTSDPPPDYFSPNP